MLDGLEGMSTDLTLSFQDFKPWLLTWPALGLVSSFPKQGHRCPPRWHFM